MQVKEIMDSKVDVCESSHSVQEVAGKMKELGVGALPIVSDNKLVGTVTDRDLVVRYLADGSSNEEISSYMTTDLVDLHPDTDVQDAVKLIAQHSVRRLPVHENGEVVGILTIGNLAANESTKDEAQRAFLDLMEA
ncbi:CBS domain-containing protein [Marinococcus halotolerans]|uniref:CBS domain-containing protein n=1 Tax=Marinococcus halotolerans TaxID=301092 RepID=UPI0003B698A0|nr:CBS domain-containing protein [Marinococcus halotolerans]